MASSTSGTTSFNLDVDEIIEQAVDSLGGDNQAGIDTEKARRTLNLVLIMLQNKNIPLSKLDYTSQALTQDVATYTLDPSIVDVLECSISNDTYDLEIERLGMKEWQRFPVKTQTGRPVQYITERDSDAVDVTLWPIPNTNDYTAKFLVSKKVEDISASFQKVDISTRYLPLLVAWLAYELSKQKQGVGDDIKNRLKMDYIELLPDTFEEDRERVDYQVRLGGISGY